MRQERCKSTDFDRWIAWAALTPGYSYAFPHRDIAYYVHQGLRPIYSVPADVAPLIHKGLFILGTNPIGYSVLGIAWFDANDTFVGMSVCQIYGEDCLWTTAKPAEIDEVIEG